VAKLLASLNRFIHGEEGATLIEYAVMLLFILIISLVAISSLANSLSGLFNDTASSI
jgi:Flp pilus assembly pilin Flp